MRRISILDRILFLITAHVAGIKIVSDMEHHTMVSTGFYTVSFGLVVLASIMLILFGFDLLTNPLVPVVATLIPTTLSIGLVQDYLPQMTLSYSILIGIIYVISVWVRFTTPEKTASLVLAMVHGICGLMVVVLPVVLFIHYGLPTKILFVSIGGVIISIEGIFLALQKLGYIRIELKTIFAWFPVMLLAATSAFVLGLHL